MNGSKQMIEGALKMKNMMRPGPMEARHTIARRATPPPLLQARPMEQPAARQPMMQPMMQPMKQPPLQPTMQPVKQPPLQPAMQPVKQQAAFAPELSGPRRGVYAELMKKHDTFNPRIKL